ncbi:nucleotidyltransferase domain-containing protein [Pyxidicoccus parkwayensis]|uniref:Nucleotidyltransferase domain-containing protein n=1 Tax=Pyxidicoccus parkwayensis TaxID=2813578 RepID=A0ABX7NWP9_9BACT|nr:nucleotidyltransferase domain-containing protein [Pyxidicoccus parkwaysis]QSQ21892.1 nucleotidyltransferase domain-containing protein [Pyxidicoccus parkwaysis]
MPPEPHRRFLDTALAVWTHDSRLLGVAAGGSLLTGRMDAFSDLDLVLVYPDDARAAVMAERLELARAAGPLLQGFTGEHVGEPRLLICLYGPPLLHVDLKFSSLTELGTRIEDPRVLWERDGALTRRISETSATPLPPLIPQWLEDRFWVWIHYGVDKARRGELFECLDMLAYLRSQVLAPLVGAAEGHVIRGVRRAELEAPGWIPALAATVARATRMDCGRALHAAVALYMQVRDAAGPVRRSGAEAAVREYLEACFPHDGQAAG